jgi:hypothetical protein
MHLQDRSQLDIVAVVRIQLLLCYFVYKKIMYVFGSVDIFFEG